MADQDARPLTDDERAELEALRAEKARREEEQARRERAELEALRAEQQAAEQEAKERKMAAQKPASASASAAKAVASEQNPSEAAEGDRTFGQRMVLSDGEDDDGIPKMPPAQKITIALCFVLALCIVGYLVLSNLGMI